MRCWEVVSPGYGVAATGRVHRARGAAVFRGQRGAAEAMSTSVAGTDVTTSGSTREVHGQGAGEKCRRDRHGHEWRRWGGALSGQVWDEHTETTAAEKAEAAPTEAEEPQSAVAKEA